MITAAEGMRAVRRMNNLSEDTLAAKRRNDLTMEKVPEGHMEIEVDDSEDADSSLPADLGPGESYLLEIGMTLA